MAKKQEGYLSGKEARRISKENRKITNQFEKKRKRRNVPESEYLTTMHDANNAVEFDNLHTYFFSDVGTVRAVDGGSAGSAAESEPDGRSAVPKQAAAFSGFHQGEL